MTSEEGSMRRTLGADLKRTLKPLYFSRTRQMLTQEKKMQKAGCRMKRIDSISHYFIESMK